MDLRRRPLETAGWAVLVLLLLDADRRRAARPRQAHPLLGDEATYAMQAASLVWDLDLAYTRQDYDRFVANWGVPPEGLDPPEPCRAATGWSTPSRRSMPWSWRRSRRLAPVRGPVVANALLLAAAALLAASPCAGASGARRRSGWPPWSSPRSPSPTSSGGSRIFSSSRPTAPASPWSTGRTAARQGSEPPPQIYEGEDTERRPSRLPRPLAGRGGAARRSRSVYRPVYLVLLLPAPGRLGSRRPAGAGTPWPGSSSARWRRRPLDVDPVDRRRRSHRLWRPAPGDLRPRGLSGGGVPGRPLVRAGGARGNASWLQASGLRPELDLAARGLERRLYRSPAATSASCPTSCRCSSASWPSRGTAGGGRSPSPWRRAVARLPGAPAVQLLRRRRAGQPLLPAALSGALVPRRAAGRGRCGPPVVVAAGLPVPGAALEPSHRLSHGRGRPAALRLRLGPALAPLRDHAVQPSRRAGGDGQRNLGEAAEPQRLGTGRGAACGSRAARRSSCSWAARSRSDAIDVELGGKAPSRLLVGGNEMRPCPARPNGSEIFEVPLGKARAVHPLWWRRSHDYYLYELRLRLPGSADPAVRPAHPARPEICTKDAVEEELMEAHETVGFSPCGTASPRRPPDAAGGERPAAGRGAGAALRGRRRALDRPHPAHGEPAEPSRPDRLPRRRPRVQGGPLGGGPARGAGGDRPRSQGRPPAGRAGRGREPGRLPGRSPASARSPTPSSSSPTPPRSPRSSASPSPPSPTPTGGGAGGAVDGVAAQPPHLPHRQPPDLGPDRADPRRTCWCGWGWSRGGELGEGARGGRNLNPAVQPQGSRPGLGKIALPAGMLCHH